MKLFAHPLRSKPMMNRRGRRWGALVAGLLGLAGLVAAAGAADQCSPYVDAKFGAVTSEVTLNEYNYSSGFIELKIDPNSAATSAIIQNGVLSVYKSSSNRTDYPLVAAIGSCPGAPEYMKFNTGSLGNDTVVVLWSDAGRTQELDYLRVGQNSYPSFQPTLCFDPSELPSSSKATFHQSALLGSSARKNLARSPDGSGAWLLTPYVGANQGTPCASNNGTLAITKTLSSLNASDWIGNNVSFRVAIALDTNASAQTSVNVTDLLPAGFSLLTASPSLGSYNPATGVWAVGGLASGGTAALDLTVKMVEPGLLTNSASVQSNDFPVGSVPPATASVTALIPAITNVVAPSLAPLNSDATFTITVTNPSLSFTAPAFSVSNVLSAGLNFVSESHSTGSFVGSTNGSWTIPSLAPGASATLSVVAKVVTSGALTDTAQVRMNDFAPASASAVATLTGVPPDAFNAWINATGRTIPTQLVGTAISLTVGAFDPAGNAASFSGEVNVSLEYCTNVVRSAPGNISCGGSWAALGGATKASFANASTTTVTLPAVGNAYEIMRVKLVPPSGSVIYATDYFAVRPAGFTVSASDGDWASAGASRSLLAPASNKHKAGRPFTLSLGSGASNYPGSTLLGVAGPTPVVSVSGPLLAGVFSAGSWSATAGGMTSNNATYSEVGALTLVLVDQHYADIDAADSTGAQRFVVGSADLQRFVPDQLRTVLTPPCGPFMYSSQPLGVEVSAYAFADAPAAPSLTRNYDAAGDAQEVTLSNAGDPANFSNQTLAKAAFTSGRGTDSDVTYQLSPAETPPRTLLLRAVDADGVSSEGGVEASIELRSGRVRVGNAYGSALLPLVLPVTLEYFKSNAERWVRNDAHACATTITVPDSTNGLIFGPPVPGKNQLAAGEVVADIGGATSGAATLAFAAGRAAIKLRAPAGAALGPGKENYGYVDLDLALGALGWPAWLPSAGRGRGDFGIYKSQRFIYRRELR